MTVLKDSTRQALAGALHVSTKQLCSLENLSASAPCLVPFAKRPFSLVVETLHDSSLTCPESSSL